MSKGVRFMDEFRHDAVAQVVERGYGSIAELICRQPRTKITKEKNGTRLRRRLLRSLEVLKPEPRSAAN